VKIREFQRGTIDDASSIGIDPSLTGFAVCAYTDDDNWLVHVLTPASRGPERLDEITTHLVRFVMMNARASDTSSMAIEGTVRNSPSASVLGELMGAVKLEVFRNFGVLPMLNVPPMSLKKYVSGSGKAVTKSQMLLAVFKKYNAEFTDDNAADAFGLARIAKGVATTKYEADVLARLDDPKFRN
jgi:Holliday junction resolvasome RuvABC endonuclease subunit